VPDQSFPDIPVLSGWARNVKSAVLHVISLAHYAIVATRGWAANSINARVRPGGEDPWLPGAHLDVAVDYLDGRKHLPLVKLKRAA
jgi:hypothetical protein